jgi:hypothetical protein
LIDNESIRRSSVIAVHGKSAGHVGRAHRIESWWRRGEDEGVLIVRATKKLLDRVGPPTLGEGECGTTLLGPWYATALFWKPQVVLLVNEATLLAVLMPLAPAATVLARMGEQIGDVLAGYGAPAAVLAEERRRMRECRIAKTASRSVVGVMNEFARLAELYRDDNPRQDLAGLAARLATTPCSPLYGRNVSPDRELAALLGSLATGQVEH